MTRAFGIAAIVLACVTAIGWASQGEAQPTGKRSYQVRVQGVASDGVIATPTPSPTPTMGPRPTKIPQLIYQPDVERWRGLVEQVFPPWTVDTVLRIMDCESKGLPGATGAAGERGLLQIHPIHYDSTYDPLGNLVAAYRISKGGNDWSPWSCA